MKNVCKFFAVFASIFTALFSLTFTVYWFNLDMKLVRKIYDKLQPHYDNLSKDRKL